ncbi:YgiQ family radical SAM protein [Halopseudomonas nanhaiensis]|uniref:YgiQ family radical SAM protein n=1 Tax=Halopseudomonas nanhaiensis TaxID=2830842 RepID=UPI001CBBB09A|nr:YgiQ family radical SAM protein [Halopseudomonas nanhaiensis]UAW99979.1 YgiQ family radical SAM protein [Halopseudomonas nanhaiensis]
MPAARPLFDYPKYWAECFGPAPFLPMSREEMDLLGWDSCDIIIVTGDAYVDHPSFGMAIIGRLLEAQGFRVGIISQPDWQSKDDFMKLGKPNLFYGVAAGNMDSMINRYTADRKIRSDDAYTPGGLAGKRPDRASVVYSQRCREAYKDVPVVLGGIEASLRRIAHYDYWQDKVRHSLLLDAKADILLYGNAERAIVEIAQRISRGEAVQSITDVRGTAFVRKDTPEGWFELDSTRIDRPGKIDKIINPYVNTQDTSACAVEQGKGDSAPVATVDEVQVVQLLPHPRLERDRTVIRLPSFEKVRNDPVLYAHANRVLHLETNPGNARALVQRHAEKDVWFNPPPIPLTTEEMDYVFGLPYARVPHPAYEGEKIPAYEMIRFSVNIMRGCFGGCTFCSITEHEGRIIQNRSHDSIIREIEEIRDKVPGFTGVISDLGGPTANMYRIACKSPEIEAACRKPSCVYPGICENLNTDHSSLIGLYRKARELPGVKKILIASGLRYDLAVESPEYVKELVTHHVGGYLKIAPEHTEEGPLSRMMKPGIGSYDRFKQMFEKYTREAGKEQYLIPYFIAAHPGTSDEDMMNLALWLKRNGFRADQVQAFYPSPMATATAMYHSGKNPLRKVTYKSDGVNVVKGERQRRLHKAFLRYHDPKNWPLLREALQGMGRGDLIGNSKQHLVPTHQPAGESYHSARRKNSTPAGSRKAGRILTQHTGLPPRDTGAGKKPRKGSRPAR